MVHNNMLDMLAQFELVITHEFTADNLADADGNNILMQKQFEQEIQMAFAEWDIEIELDKDIHHTQVQHHSFLGRLQRSALLNTDDVIDNDMLLHQMKSDVIQCCNMIAYDTMLVSFRCL